MHVRKAIISLLHFLLTLFVIGMRQRCEKPYAIYPLHSYPNPHSSSVRENTRSGPKEWLILLSSNISILQNTAELVFN
jgi:hypothetical protein